MIFTENPFFIIGASPCDSKAMLFDKAEEKAFFLSEAECRKAVHTLLTPRKRLKAELSWFPGVSIKDIEHFLRKASKRSLDLEYMINIENYPKLAYANSIALYLSTQVIENLCDEAISNLIQVLCSVSSRIRSSSVQSFINKDRIIAGLPEIVDTNELEQELETQKYYYKKVLHDFLDQFDSERIITLLTKIIEKVTKKGNEESPWSLIDDIIIDYEVESIPFFDAQEKKIDKKIAEFSELMRLKGSQKLLRSYFNALKKDIILWDRIAQPIQVLLRSQGLEHKRSKTLSDKLRTITLLAHNKYKYTEISLDVTEFQEEIFAESREISETINEDKKTLKRLARQQEEDLNYFVEWGWVFKKSVNITSKEITINRIKTYQFKDIKGILWGGTRNYVNGVPTGASYKIQLLIKKQTVIVPIRNETVYREIVDKLWKIAGVTLMLKTIELLTNGRCVSFGDVTLHNEGIELTRSSWFFSSKKIFQWSEIKSIYSESGSLVISVTDPRYNTQLPYLNIYNVHIVEMVIRKFLEKNKNQ